MMPPRLWPALALMLAAGSGPALAESYVVGVETTSYFPHYEIERGQFGGYGRAVLDAFARAKGHQFTYNPRPIRELFQDFAAGKADLKYPDNPRWGVESKAGSKVHYSNSVTLIIDGALVLPARQGAGLRQVKTLALLAGFTPLGWQGHLAAGKVKLVEAGDVARLLQLCLTGKADACYANVAVANYQLAAVMRQPEALVFDSGLPHDRDAFHLSSIRHPALIDAFDAYLKDQAAEIAALKAKYEVERGLD